MMPGTVLESDAFVLPFAAAGESRRRARVCGTLCCKPLRDDGHPLTRAHQSLLSGAEKGRGSGFIVFERRAGQSQRNFKKVMQRDRQQ